MHKHEVLGREGGEEKVGAYILEKELSDSQFVVVFVVVLYTLLQSVEAIITS